MAGAEKATAAAGADATGNQLSAELSSRHFRPGGVVRGVVNLHTDREKADASTEIAYVVAQIHAHVTVDSNLLTVPVVPLLSPRSASQVERERAGSGAGAAAPQGAFFFEKMSGALPDVRSFSGDTGTCIYQSVPTTLLSDINIAPTQQELESASEAGAVKGKDETAKRCRREFALALPEVACPTFRGTAARVFYVLSITAQSVKEGSTPFSVHLPFEVYAPEYFFQPTTLESADEYAAMHGNNGKGASPSSSIGGGDRSPKRSNLRKERSISVGVIPVGVRKGNEIPFELRPSLMHGRVETELMQRAQTSIFTIGKDSSHLVRFLLTKQFYQPGEILLGVFDFSRAVIPCYEVTATLCLEETLSSMSLDPSRVVHSREFGSFHEYTGSVLHTNVRFCIPQDALPSIRTDLVCFQWVIRFEFTAGVVPDPAASGDDATANSSAAQRQTFRWQVPIVVRPASATERSQYANVPHKLFSGSRRTIKLE
ncbi:Choline-phosphate cytidylyltransferase b, partial [Globisporangium splendens]